MAETLPQLNQTFPYRTFNHTEEAEQDTLLRGANRNRELLRLRASRLVDLFPDELVIQEKTVSVIKNQLVMSSMDTIPIKDIEKVVYSKVPFLGGLRIIEKNSHQELRVKGIGKERAKKAKEMIERMLTTKYH